jgi:amino acid adenylation domain-containing protein
LNAKPEGPGMLSRSQREQYAARLRQGRAGAVGAVTRRGAVAGLLPLSFGQEQLWFLDRFAPGLATYNVPQAIRLRGGLDQAVLGLALDDLVARHESLRTRFVADRTGRPAQEIDQPTAGRLLLSDLSALDPAAREAERRRITAQDAGSPFDLAKGPLLRTRLIRCAPDEHVLLLVVHHIVFDGWSAGVLLRELTALYNARATGTPAELAELPVQFADYALWERERTPGPGAPELLEYWRETLAGSQILNLPADRPRPVVQDFTGAVHWTNLGPDLLEQLRRLSSRAGATLFATLLAGLLAALHRHCGQDDLVVGTVSANRSRPGLAPLIGYLVNTLPIRADASGDPPFREFLARVRETTVSAYAHQDLPFAKLVEELGLERDPSRAPLFQITMTCTETGDSPAMTGLDVEPVRVELPAAKFDLDLAFEARPDGLWLELSYATALFDPETITGFTRHLKVLLEGAAHDPSLRLSALPLLTEPERHRELVQWNDTACELPTGSLHGQFEAQAARTPEAIAVLCGEETLTYAELDAQSNQVARWLRGLGAGPEVLVGVGIAPSVRRVVVLLGILKAGSGYVPLDSALPAERVAYMVADTGMPLAVVDTAAAEALGAGKPAASGVRAESVDEAWNQIAELSTENPQFEVEPSTAAYVIYTSGSTGQPKGVVVEHRQAVNFVGSMLVRWPLGPADRVLQFASLNFDASVLEMFTALAGGAAVAVVTRDEALSPPRLGDLIRRRKVTFACLPPAVLALLADQQFPDFKVLLSGGEHLPADLARAWTRPGLRLFNAYGPTENAVVATVAQLSGGAESAADGAPDPAVPIGLPLANQQAYVLDRYRNPAPAGSVGELYLGGANVARGYLNAPELTKERFLPDPFRPGPGARLYRTGDLVRRRADGRLVFLGRADGQVKLRGLRVELGEIEAALAAHPAVAQAAVVLGPDRSGQPRLVGYVRCVPGAPAADPEQLRRFLEGRLPAYMVPAHLLTVEAFPLNLSGKLDRTALPAPESAGADRAAADRYTAPGTPTEAALAGLYAGLLGRDRVGADDGFFELGGNSLQVMQLVSRIFRDLAVDLGVTEVFLAPTPRRLAERVDRARAAAGHPPPGPGDRLVELTEPGKPAVFLVHAIGGTVHPYAELALRLAGTYSVYGIEAAGLRGRAEPAGSLPALVDAYLQAIRAAQPTGPYRLGGWSMGAVLAFEITRILESEGAEVELLALLDPPYPTAGKSGPSGADQHGDGAGGADGARRFAADAARILGRTLPEPGTAEACDLLGWLARQLDPADPGSGDPAATRSEIDRRYRVFSSHTRAFAGYRPSGPIHAATLLVGARRSPNVGFLPQWSALAHGKTVPRIIEGDHYTFLQPPSVQEVADLILAGVSSSFPAGK